MSSSMQLKPVFVGWIALVAQVPLQIFFTIWAGGFFGSILGNTIESKLIIGTIAFLAVPTLCWIAKKFNYKNTTYNIFEDRIELEEGFFTVQQKTVRFDDVREVTLRKGILQRSCNLGSIYLATQATGSGTASAFGLLGLSSASGSGFTIRDVNNSEEIYKTIKEMAGAKS